MGDAMPCNHSRMMSLTCSASTPDFCQRCRFWVGPKETFVLISSPWIDLLDAAIARALAAESALVTARRVAGEALDEWAASYEDDRTSNIPREHPRIAALRAELEKP